MTTDTTTTRIEETETGFELVVRSVRGTGTRDQDEVKCRAKAVTLEEIESQAERVRTLVTNEMNARRAHQPDAPDTPDDTDGADE